MALILGIETSNPSAASPVRPGVALARGAADVLGSEPIAPDRPNEDDLVPAIDRLFRRLALAPRDLTHIAVSIGPGGFTAIRLAVTAAKMIAEATGAQCLPVPTAAAVARRVDHTGRFAVALASKGDSAYVTVFDPSRGADPGKLMTSADASKLDVGLIIADQFFPQPMRAAAEDRGIPVRAPVFDPVAVIEVALSGSVAPVDPADLLPLYPREPEAVTKWRKLHRPVA